MPSVGCSHKEDLGCILTAVPVCCSCADQRPHTNWYAVYVDGQGMTMTGSPWQRYCWRCRNYWRNRTTPEAASSQPETSSARIAPWSDHTPGWAFPPQNSRSDTQNDQSPQHRRRRHNRPPHTNLETPSSLHTPVVVSGANGRRRPPRNPFGTREEWEAPDYQSPLEGMFTRAWNRYHDAEDNRRREDQQAAEMSRRNRNRVSEAAATSETVPNSAYSTGNTLTAELQRVRRLAEDMAHAVEAAEGLHLTTEIDTTPRVNPIDAQQRPPPLSTEQMTVSLACRVCNEQKVDTLAEPCMHICRHFASSFWAMLTFSGMCHWCSEIIRQQSQEARRRRIPGQRLHNLWRCPICRKDIMGVRRVYLV